MGRLVTVLCVLACAAPARAQIQVGGAASYQQLYGEPVRVGVWDLAQSPESYDGRAVRTHGRLEQAFGSVSTGRRLTLRDSAAAAVDLVPVPELNGVSDADTSRMLGHDAEVVGVFRMYGGRGTGDVGTLTNAGQIVFWELTGGPDERPAKSQPAPTYTLEALLEQAERRAGQRVRVVGQFRGSNLFGDLPTRSRVRSDDWVLKDDVYAIWISGRKPKGKGFNLDAGLKRDTGKWLEIVGRVSARAGVVYVEAESVDLTTAPTPTASVADAPPPPERPKVPPVIVFSLPLDGEADLRGDERFVVQFSKDMDESSFERRVLLRYAGPTRPGDRGFDVVKLSYDGGRRALTVDPGDRLRPGRAVELILLEGIVDLEGLALQSRQPHDHVQGAAVDVLRWTASAY